MISVDTTYMAYYFGNMYLSSIQQGIQALHSTARMFVKYRNSPEKLNIVYEWAENHETVVLLNGGYSSSIRELNEFFENQENPYPFCPFYEGNDALDGALTCTGIILSNRIFDTASLLRKSNGWWNKHESGWRVVYTYNDMLMYSPFDDITAWEKDLIEKLNTFQLAR